MGEAKRRAAVPALISILIPERGRPEALERLTVSLFVTAGNDQRFEVLVAIDEDDLAWDGSVPARERVRYFVRPRPKTLGEKLDLLAKDARGDILLFLANDTVMVTEGWPGKIREAVAALPNGIGVPYVRDPLHPGHASYPILTRKHVETAGFFMAPWFPYWFIDTWWDEIGILSGIKFEVDVEIDNPDGRGRTHGLVDLPFWTEVFHETRPLRMRDAVKLATVAFGEHDVRTQDVMTRLPERAAECVRRVAHLADPAFQAKWAATAESEPGPHYAEVKAFGETLIAQMRQAAPKRLKVAIAVPSTRSWEATTANSIVALAAYSAQFGISIACINVQSSDIAHGRNCTVEICLKEGVDFILFIDSDMTFPPDALVRLLKHDKDIVGCVYNKRTRDPNTGKFQTLGMLKGPRPEKIDGGLHEALLLPGGFMLIRAEVFRRLGWPYYFNSFRFPGRDGLDGFKTMMRRTLSSEPPPEVLAEFDTSKLGEWLRTHYTIGEGGQDVPTFSEDLSFTSSARKAGFTAWCDVGLSWELGHLGQFPVTCLPPEKLKDEAGGDLAAGVMQW